MPSVRFAPLAAPARDQEEEQIEGEGELDAPVEDRDIDRGLEVEVVDDEPDAEGDAGEEQGFQRPERPSERRW